MRCTRRLATRIGLLLLLRGLETVPVGQAAESTIASFSTHSLDVRAWQRGLAVADLDRDGTDEIVISSDIIDCPLPAAGATSEATPTATPTATPGDSPGALSDAATCIAIETIRIFRNGVEQVQTWMVREHAAPGEIVLGDLNGDQYPDLVSAYTDRLEVRFNDGTGLLGSPESYPGPGIGYLAVADFDGDADNDLLALGNSGSGIILRAVTPDSLVPDSITLGGVVRQLAVLDANLDGRPDLAGTVEATGGYRLRLYPGAADSFFGDPIVGLLVGHSIVAGDFDEDGIPDIVDEAGLFLKGAGDGTFAPIVPSVPFAPIVPSVPFAPIIPSVPFAPIVPSVPFAPIAPFTIATTLPGSADDIASANVDLDGHLDLITRSGQPFIRIRLGHGDGTFDAPLEVTTAPYPWLIRSGEFDADDRPDLVVLSYQGGNATVLLNLGDWLTATSIQDVQATRDGSAVELHWRVGDENTRNLYAILRGSPDLRASPDRLDRLTSRPMTGRTEYTWRDEYPLPGLFDYWIEETTPRGAVELFGPIKGPAVSSPAVEVGPIRPNPSAGPTSLTLTLPMAGLVRIDLYDALGRWRGTLTDTHLPAGRHELPVAVASETGGRLSSGHYWLRVAAGGASVTRRLIHLD